MSQDGTPEQTYTGALGKQVRQCISHLNSFHLTRVYMKSLGTPEQNSYFIDYKVNIKVNITPAANEHLKIRIASNVTTLLHFYLMKLKTEK